MDRPTMRGWWQDEDGAWHPPGTEPPPAPAPEPKAEAEPEPAPEPEFDDEAEAAFEAEPEPYAEAEPYDEAEPEPTLAETRAAPVAVRPGTLRPSPAAEWELETVEPEPEPTLVEETVVETPAPARVAPTRPVVVARPAPRPPVAVPDEARWRTGHLIAAALAGLLIGAFIGAALKDDSPSTTLASGSSTTLLVTSTTVPSGVPGLFGTTAPSGLGSSGGQAQGGPNITAANPFGASPTISPTISPTTVFGSGLTPTTTSGAVTPLTSFVGDGTFRVGTDIQPGTYRSNGPASPGVPCTWERQATFGDSTSVIDANAVLEPVTVTILPSDRGFRTARCQTWTRVG